jgi:hypothetical protein
MPGASRGRETAVAEGELYEGLEALKLTIFETAEWRELINRENYYGPEQVLEEILDKRTWSNAEILWVTRRLLYHYGGKDRLLKQAPVERVFLNFAGVLRVLFMLLDHLDPELDENMRAYVSAKLADATWGINERTRYYLRKAQS